MSLYKTFATNLRQLCEMEQSIADVCRATGIHRSQMNRYLSGERLPTHRNLQRISEYFGLAEAELFYVGDQGAPATVPAVRQPVIQQVLRLTSSEQPASLPPATYFTDFAYPGDPNCVVRATMVVRVEGNLTTFRRLTGFAERPGAWWSHYRGDHRGVVIERRHWLYFVALNDSGTREPSMMTLRWAETGTPMLVGQAIVLTPLGPNFTGVVMTPCRQGMKLRQALRRSHTYTIDDPAIDSLVVDSLAAQMEEIAKTYRYLDISVTDMTAPQPSVPRHP